MNLEGAGGNRVGTFPENHILKGKAKTGLKRPFLLLNMK